MKMTLFGFSLIFLMATSAYAGADLNRVNKLGAKYCLKAPAYLSETSLPQIVLENLKKEASVYKSICTEHGGFVGKQNTTYPSVIPVNMGAIQDSWTTIAENLQAGKSPSSEIVSVYVQEAKVVQDSITPYLKFYNDEYSTEFKKNGVTEERVIQKAFTLDLFSGANLNKAARGAK